MQQWCSHLVRTYGIKESKTKTTKERHGTFICSKRSTTWVLYHSFVKPYRYLKVVKAQ